VLARVARSSGSDLAWRQRGGVCPYAVGTSELDRGIRWPRVAHRLASAHCLGA
jgi:hypothetical protein